MPKSRGVMALAFLLISCAAVGEAPLTNESMLSVEREVLAADPSFDARERRRSRSWLRELDADLPGLSDIEVQLRLARILALADNGHTNLLPAHWAVTEPRLGVQFLLADDGLFVADARPPWQDLVGKKVTQIGVAAPDALRDLWAEYQGGAPGWADESFYFLLETPSALAALGISERASEVRLGFSDGMSTTVGTTPDWQQPEAIFAFLPPDRMLGLARRGAVSSAPLYLQEPNQYLRTVELPELDAVYVQFRANIDFSGTTDLKQASDALAARISETRPRYVILDQRSNIGGDLNTTRALMEALPGLVGEEGKVIAFVSGRTFSAGISSLGYLKQAAPEGRLVLIGEPPGDGLEFYSEGDLLQPPRTSAAILYARERHNYVTGCPEEDCHRSIRTHPIRIDHLEPDIRPVVPYAAILAGDDPFIDAAADIIRAERSGKSSSSAAF